MTTLKKISPSPATPASAAGHGQAAPPAPAAPAAPARPHAGKTPEAKTVVKKTTVKNAVVKKVSAKKTAARPLLSRMPAPVKAGKPAVPHKSKKPKLVRDSFTIPKAEYVVLEDLKQRATKLTRPVKKSELLRAGIKILASLSDTAYLAALEQVPAIKTGRPVLKK